MSDLSTVVVAFVTVLVGGYLNNFVAEDYRRFRDSKALAGALAGELDSHRMGIETLRPRLDAMLARVIDDKPLALNEVEKPVSPIFEANVQRIGLLGPEIARQVAAVYEQLNGFRVGYVMLSKHHSTMSREWREAVISECILRVDTASEMGTGLLAALNTHAKADYRIHWPVFG